ncbi:MAG: chromate efflux transporter [bacterium]|jgi:chromate transporter
MPDTNDPLPSVAEIFAAFLRLGISAFGGPAMVAYIRDLAVARKRWLTEESFRDGVALCQSLPGATAMQTAAYAGLRARGLKGAVAAYTGFGLPAFILMVAFSVLYRRGHDLPAVASVFRGLQVIVVALVANATLNFGKVSLKGWKDILVALAAAAFLGTGGSPIVAVAGAAAIGLLLHPGFADGPVDQGSNIEVSPFRGLKAAAPLALFALVCFAVVFSLDRKLFELAAVMLKVDLFAFGGGFASVPLMLHEVVEARNWLDTPTFLDGIALGQVTPGPIVITATFVGYQVAGPLGALVATVAIFTPSLVVLVAAVPYADGLRHSPIFRRALQGVLASFVGLLLAVTLRFAVNAPWGVATGAIGVLAFLSLRLGVDVLWVVLAGALISVVLL